MGLLLYVCSKKHDIGLPKHFTVVKYNPWKNDKCHIFVYYETYYDQEGLEYTTAIRNTYAVDRKTGKVTESGKHAWEDTGNKAYREAAGEP